MITTLKNFNFEFCSDVGKKNKVYYQCKRGFSRQACKTAKLITFAAVQGYMSLVNSKA